MTHPARIIPIASFALALVVACGGSEETASPAATAESPSTSAQAPAAAASEPAAETDSGVSVDVAKGEQIYATYCGSCHGAGGAGDGPAAAALDPQPAKHTDGEYMNALTNEHLFKVIEKGGPAVGKSALMAPWGGTLSDAQIWDVVAFVRSLAVPPYEGSVP
ncbi:c-type cytochrome [Myxococcota bacterium]|nr:c-type cytochrome [Myxococcota bacterium]MCZ7620758.1 cytochrome c [Myxococcota bacterium]